VSGDPFLTDEAIFAAIASYEAAVECLNAIGDRPDDEKLEECGRAYHTALDRMLSTAPITRAGCVALIEAFLASLRDELGLTRESFYSYSPGPFRISLKGQATEAA
jgi:hypothetical protein